jgi:hypothetical protein
MRKRGGRERPGALDLNWAKNGREKEKPKNLNKGKN